MMTNRYTQIFRCLLREIINFLLFILVYKISALLLSKALFGKEELEESLVRDFINTSSFILSFPAFYSLTHAMKRNDNKSKDVYLRKDNLDTSLGGRLRDVLSSRVFWVEIFCLFILLLIVPTYAFCPFVSTTLFVNVELSDIELKLFALLFVFPALFLLHLFATTSVNRNWIIASKNSKRNNDSEKKLVKDVFRVILLCSLSSILISLVFPFFLTVWNFLDGYMMFVWFGIAVISIIVLRLCIFSLRAIHKRRVFIKNIRKTCNKIGAKLSKIKKPYSSIFFRYDGISFTVTNGKKIYACKLLSSVMPNSQIVFSEKGNAISQHTIKIFNVEVFNLMNRIDYYFESEGCKLLILVPVSKQIFVAGEKDSAPRLADTGEVIGNYQIYTGTGFVNSLERDCIMTTSHVKN